jgi:hypothetical protein
METFQNLLDHEAQNALEIDSHYLFEDMDDAFFGYEYLYCIFLREV